MPCQKLNSEEFRLMIRLRWEQFLASLTQAPLSCYIESDFIDPNSL